MTVVKLTYLSAPHYSKVKQSDRTSLTIFAVVEVLALEDQWRFNNLSTDKRSLTLHRPTYWQEQTRVNC